LRYRIIGVTRKWIIRVLPLHPLVEGPMHNKFINTGPITEPCGTPLVRWMGSPSGETAEVVSHRSMYSKHQGSFMCFAIAFLNSDQSSSSNARRMSNSTHQSYSQHRWRILATASTADLLS